MGILKTGISAIGKLFIVAALAGTFIVGMISVVYLSLSGEEVKVPEIVGKNYLDSEKELAGLGLKVKRRALRYSTEKPNTILEQLPRPGETVKTGQTILVVLSQANPEGEEAPVTIEKNKEEEAETAPDLEIPSDKKKTNKNANVKKATTTRDVEKSNKNSNSNTSTNTNSSNSNQSGTANKAANTATPSTPANKANPTPNTKTIIVPSASPRPNNSPKPVAAKTPVSGGDVRSRRVN